MTISTTLRLPPAHCSTNVHAHIFQLRSPLRCGSREIPRHLCRRGHVPYTRETKAEGFPALHGKGWIRRQYRLARTLCAAS
jgi:hypothetical protein